MSFSAEASARCSGDGDALVEPVGPRVDISMRGDRKSGLPEGQVERRKTANRDGVVARIVLAVKNARRQRGINYCYPDLIHGAPPHDEAGDADMKSFRNGVMIQARRELSDENADDHSYGLE